MLRISISSFPASRQRILDRKQVFDGSQKTTHLQGIRWRIMPAFTDYIRDVSQFRKFERKLLVLAAEAQRE